MIVQVIDKPVTQYLTDIKTVGIYNANYKLGIFMMLMVSMFDYAWRPFFLNNANEQGAKELFSKVMTAFVGVTSVVFIVLTFFISDIVRIPLPFKGHIIGEHYWSGVYIVPVVLLSYVFLGICTNLVAGIYIEKKTRYLPLTTGISAVINIVFCFALIPFLGILGGAIATLASYIAMALSTYLIVQRFYEVKYETRKIFLMLAVNLSALTLFYLSFSALFLNSLVIRIVLTIIFCSIIVNLSGLQNVKKLLSSSTGKK
jgi:O-antigen/teichoic acid export membrane protein